MDLKAALAHTKQHKASNVVGLQIYGRTIELFRPRYFDGEDCCRIEYREGALFHDYSDKAVFDTDNLPADGRDAKYFVAPLEDAELDSLIESRSEVMLHRLLDGAPDPSSCINPRDKAVFTTWCISALAAKNS